MAKLKIYAVLALWVREAKPAANGSQQCYAVVAAPTKKRAVELFGVSPYHFKNYGVDMANDEGTKVALSKPETVFWKQESYVNEDGENVRDGSWHELRGVP